VRKIRDISEDEMIAVFLQTELNSTRFQRDIEAYLQQEKIDPHMLYLPDWRNAQENALRRAILGMYRGYGRNEGYFIGFPTGVRWERVTLTREELEQVRYIDYDYWVELSGGTRMAIDGAKNALAGKVVFGVSSDGLVYMANELRRGAQFPTLIFVAKDVDAYLVVMEGHVRLTAYLIAPEYIPSELEVIVGYCEQITEWGCY
jgi:hypothetical protein